MIYYYDSVGRARLFRDPVLYFFCRHIFNFYLNIDLDAFTYIYFLKAGYRHFDIVSFICLCNQFSDSENTNSSHLSCDNVQLLD